MQTQTNGKISAPELKRALEQDEQLLVVNVLSEQKYEREHIPGSVNVPLSADKFEPQVREAASGKDQRIVVHCSDPSCDASKKAANHLEKAGYTNVQHFVGGMEEWKRQGFKVEQGSPAMAQR